MPLTHRVYINVIFYVCLRPCTRQWWYCILSPRYQLWLISWRNLFASYLFCQNPPAFQWMLKVSTHHTTSCALAAIAPSVWIFCTTSNFSINICFFFCGGCNCWSPNSWLHSPPPTTAAGWLDKTACRGSPPLHRRWCCPPHRRSPWVDWDCNWTPSCQGRAGRKGERVRAWEVG